MACDPPSSRPRVIRYGLDDLAEQVEAFWQRWPGARADADGAQFVCAEPGKMEDLGRVDGPGMPEARLALPLAGPRADPGEQIGSYCERLATIERPECQLVLLLRAGAMAFGCWRDGELVQHKAVRKYVVRGNGKSQATHLKTRGKSRYGSRLRLQNWRSLLAETNERVADCEQQFGPFDRILYAIPIRVVSELFSAEPPPPFGREDVRLHKLPMHVHRPDHEELLRVRALLLRGQVELPS